MSRSVKEILNFKKGVIEKTIIKLPEIVRLYRDEKKTQVEIGKYIAEELGFYHNKTFDDIARASLVELMNEDDFKRISDSNRAGKNHTRYQQFIKSFNANNARIKKNGGIEFTIDEYMKILEFSTENEFKYENGRYKITNICNKINSIYHSGENIRGNKTITSILSNYKLKYGEYKKGNFDFLIVN